MSDEIIFIDVEASGLHASSYPIEVGWCGLNLKADSFLIRPASHWSEWDWSIESEKIHGIRREECIRGGLDVWDAAKRLNDVVGDKAVFTDAPGFDVPWVAKLYDACGVEPGFSFQFLDAMPAIRDEIDGRREDLMWVEQRLRRIMPRPHRAAADASYLAALWRCAHEEGFLEKLEGGAL